MKQEPKSQYWLDVEVARIMERFPDGEIVVSSGISPSASYHIGHFREILTAEALTWGLVQAGREVKHVHVVDNMDPLRKRYDFLPEEYERYVGWPVCLVPSPVGDGSYADHFYNEFKNSTDKMGIEPAQVIRSYEDLYVSGKMTSQIEKVLGNLDLVKAIFARFGREVADDWTPVQVKKDDNKFVNARPNTWDKKAKTIEGVSYENGGAKLNWRLDWPARWQVLGVQVEPFGIQEHGAAGSSYETGMAFSKEIFGHEPPLPAGKYGNIHLSGDTKKMSSSLGNLITPSEALSIMPPGMLRYFVVRSRPERTLRFDTDQKLINLYDEYKQVMAAVKSSEPHEFAEAYHFAAIGDQLSEVPFGHLVSVYQAALGDTDKTIDILKRTGYEAEKSALENELKYVDNWLESYAPDSVKFSLQNDLPKIDLTEGQIGFLADMASKIEAQAGLDAEWVHTMIYEMKDTHNLKPAEAFQAVYQVLLGQKSGPKIGWFLTTLDKEWLIKRLRLEE